MKIDEITPSPLHCRKFSPASRKYMPDVPGCYVCTDIYRVILYIGLSESISRRFAQHLKRKEMKRVRYFYWLEASETRMTIKRLERSWVELHDIKEGNIPEINKIYPHL